MVVPMFLKIWTEGCCEWDTAELTVRGGYR